MSAPEQYRGSITREQWLVNETRIVARLRADEALTDADEVIEKVVAENLFGYPTERTVKSVARACNRRLEALFEPASGHEGAAAGPGQSGQIVAEGHAAASPFAEGPASASPFPDTPAGAVGDSATYNQLLYLVAHGTTEQLRQTNLYAMARDNRVVWDFLTALVGPKVERCDYYLSKREIASFVEGLGAQDEKAATWSDATKNKIRQVLSTCLEACSMYNRKTEELTCPLLDIELEGLMRSNGDQALLPAFGINPEESMW